jgi:hypothetical protein
MTYTDQQLMAALAKILPSTIHWDTRNLFWNGESDLDVRPVLHTELLHLCAVAEDELKLGMLQNYDMITLKRDTWQRRVVALANIHDIEI